MESAKEKVSNLPPEIKTNQRVFQELKKTLSDLTESIGTALTPILVDLSEEFIILAQATAKSITALNKFFGLGEEAKTIEEIDLTITHLNADIKDLQNTIDSQKNATDFTFLPKDFSEEIQIKGIKLEIEKLIALKKSLETQEETKKTPDANTSSISDESGKKQFEQMTKEIALHESARRVVMADTVDFQIEQLNILENKFLLIGEHSVESEQYFAEQRKAIYDKEKEEKIANEIEVANKIKQGLDLVTSEYQKNVERRRDNEIQALKDSLSYEQGTAEERKTMEKNVKKEFAKEEKRLFMMKKMSTIAQITLDTAQAMTEALPNVPLSLAIAGLGTIQQGIALATPPPKYEQGGLIGGRRHSQGGTMIEAERGEFIMSRNAVESIGTETLNQMNQSGGAGITLNISAPLVDETIIDTIIPAIKKAQKMDLA